MAGRRTRHAAPAPEARPRRLAERMIKRMRCPMIVHDRGRPQRRNANAAVLKRTSITQEHRRERRISDKTGRRCQSLGCRYVSADSRLHVTRSLFTSIRFGRLPVESNLRHATPSARRPPGTPAFPPPARSAPGTARPRPPRSARSPPARRGSPCTRRTPPPSAAPRSRPRPRRQLHEQVQLRRRHLEVITQALVRLIHQCPTRSKSPAAQRVDRLQHPPVLSDHVPRAPAQRLRQPLSTSASVASRSDSTPSACAAAAHSSRRWLYAVSANCRGTFESTTTIATPAGSGTCSTSSERQSISSACPAFAQRRRELVHDPALHADELVLRLLAQQRQPLGVDLDSATPHTTRRPPPPPAPPTTTAPRPAAHRPRSRGPPPAARTRRPATPRRRRARSPATPAAPSAAAHPPATRHARRTPPSTRAPSSSSRAQPPPPPSGRSPSAARTPRCSPCARRSGSRGPAPLRTNSARDRTRVEAASKISRLRSWRRQYRRRVACTAPAPISYDSHARPRPRRTVRRRMQPHRRRLLRHEAHGRPRRRRHQGRAPAGDPDRALGPFPGGEPHPEKSGTFLYLNCNKQGVTLDITTTAVARSSRASSGTPTSSSTTSRRPRPNRSGSPTTARLGKHRLVMTSISPFGQDGPHRDCKAYDLTTLSAGGWTWLNGWPGHPEMPPLTPLRPPERRTRPASTPRSRRWAPSSHA